MSMYVHYVHVYCIQLCFGFKKHVQDGCEESMAVSESFCLFFCVLEGGAVLSLGATSGCTCCGGTVTDRLKGP